MPKTRRRASNAFSRGLEGFKVERLGLRVAALVLVQDGQVVHGVERGRVVVPEHALAGLEGFEVERLGLVVAALVLVQDGQVVRRGERGRRPRKSIQ